MFNLPAVQTALRELGFDAWLLYDFRGLNVLARRVLGFAEGAHGSRRCFYCIPAEGPARKLVHRIEAAALDHLPGEKSVYLRWQELEAGIRELLVGRRRLAMEFAPGVTNPYIARVDAGTIDFVRSLGCEVASSGDLIQLFEATWDDEQWAMHVAAAEITDSAFTAAWKFIARRVRESGGVEETAVRDVILEHFDAHRATTYSPPIVARGPHSGLPHYETGNGDDTRIRSSDLVLIDLWAKLQQPRAVYSDLTRIGYVGATVPDEYARVFAIVAAARDAGIRCVEEAFAAGRPLRGFEVDDAVRGVIDKAGYGPAFIHRTGHNIGQEVHGNGANMDNLETHDERRVLPRTCFSIEPGIYLPEFGIRSEVDVYVDAAGGVHVTGGAPQTEILPIVAAFPAN